MPALRPSTRYIPTLGVFLKTTRNISSIRFVRPYKTAYNPNSLGISSEPRRLSFSTAAKGDDPLKDSQINKLVENERLAPVVQKTPSSSDFSDLARKGVFVDKTHALQDFIDHPSIDLLLRPRRSGKTTLLRMFRTFFEFASPDKLAKRRELFINNKLAITQDPRFEMEFGQYPVLYVDLVDVNGVTMADLFLSFKTCVSQIARRLDDAGLLRNRGKLGGQMQTSLNAILTGTVPNSELHLALFQLTEILHTLHGRQVIVLIDEYDTPTSYAVQQGYLTEANNLFRNAFVRLLKNNEHVHGALIVGILRVAKTGWLSGLNNLSVFPLGESSKYDTACMFTEDETRKLYDQRNRLKKLPFTFDDLQSWYNGYSTLNGVKLLNPWSVSQALAKGQLDVWWTKSGYDDVIQAHIMKLLKNDDVFRDQCETLLAGDKIKTKIDPDMAYASIQDMSRDQLWTLIYYAGYLSPVSRRSTGVVRIPNSEIRSEFRAWIRKDLECRMTPSSLGDSVSLFRTMTDGKFAEFAKKLGACMITTLPDRLLGSNEKVYQESLYFYFAGAADASERNPPWTIRMERKAGDGRADIFFYRGDIGVVLELKNIRYEKQAYGKSEQNRLSKLAKKALSQCDLLQYHRVMPESVTTVFEYGVAFLGTYCAVQARAIEKVGGTWTRKGDEYTAEQDEQRREDVYRKPRGRSKSTTVNKAD